MIICRKDPPQCRGCSLSALLSIPDPVKLRLRPDLPPDSPVSAVTAGLRPAAAVPEPGLRQLRPAPRARLCACAVQPRPRPWPERADRPGLVTAGPDLTPVTRYSLFVFQMFCYLYQSTSWVVRMDFILLFCLIEFVDKILKSFCETEKVSKFSKLKLK